MQAVARVEARRHAGRMGAIAQHGIEVDHRIEGAAQAYPGVHLPAQIVLFGLVVVVQRRAWQGALERRQGGAYHAQAVAARPGNQLAIALCHVLQRGTRRLPRKGRAGPGNIVDAQQHDEAAHTGLGQHITLQPRQRMLAHAIGQQARARNAGIDRSEEHTSELQSPCNLVCRLLLEKKKNLRLPSIPTLARRSRISLQTAMLSFGRRLAMSSSRKATSTNPYTARTRSSQPWRRSIYS